MREFEKVITATRNKFNFQIIFYFSTKILILSLLIFDIFFFLFEAFGSRINEMFLLALTLKILLILLIIYLIWQANKLLINKNKAARLLDQLNNDKSDNYQNAFELFWEGISGNILEKIFHKADIRAREQSKTGRLINWPRMLIIFLVLFILQIFLFLSTGGRMQKAYNFWLLTEKPPIQHKLVVELEPEDLDLIRNTDITIRVIDPEPEVEHLFNYKIEEKWRQEKIFNHQRQFSNLDFSFSYFVETPYARSDTFRIEVFENPAVRVLNLKYDYPDYTSLKPEYIKNSNGNIKVLKGTEVKLDIEANNPITSASIIFSDGIIDQMERTGRNTFETGFTVTHNSNYHLNLIDILGNKSNKISKSITVIPDKIPEIKIIYPGRDTIFNQDMILPLQIFAADDFGLRDLNLRYYINNGNELVENIQERIDRNILEINYLFDLSQTFLIPGDQVTYWAEISDNSPLIQKSVSPRYIVRFPSIEEIYREIEEEERAKTEIMEETLDRSLELQEEYEEKRRELLKKEELDWEDRKEIENFLDQQEELNKDIEKMAEDYQKLIDKFSENKALSSETLEKMEKIKELMEEIANEQIQEAMEKLKESLDKIDPDVLKKAMEEFKFSMEDFSKKLDQTLELLEQIKKEQSIQKALEIAEEMQEMQENLNEKTMDKEIDNQKLAEEQKNIADKMENLQEQLQEANELLDENKDAEVLEEMQNLQQQMAQDSLMQDMEDAQEQLQQNNREQAQQSQQNSLKKMQNMTRMLSSMQQMMSSGAMMEMEEIINKTIQRLMIFSMKHETLNNRFMGDPYEILLELIAGSEGVNITLNELYQVPMIILVLGPKFIYDANFTFAKYREFFQEVNDGSKVRLSGYLSEIQQGLNIMIFDLLQASGGQQGGGSGSGMQSMMQALQQMGQQQMMINMLTQALFQKMGEQGRMTSDMMAEAQRLARDEERLAENLKRMLQNNPEAQKQTSALNQIIDDLESLSRNLKQGRLTQDMVDQQERILSRLLDAQKSVHKREFSKKRKSEISEKELWEIPEELKLKFDKMREKALLNEDYKKYPQEYQELIKEYLKLLNEKVSKIED